MEQAVLREVIKEQADSFRQKELGVQREMMDQIRPFLDAPHVLVISGLRRSGKSTFLAQIARKYFNDAYFYINFEDNRLIDFTVKDFELLLQGFIELFGEKKVVFMDEVQNVPGWEVFVRRIFELGYKVIVTGSNASLLSGELGARLTGRYLPINIFPFSFREFLRFKDFDVQKFLGVLTTAEKGNIRRIFSDYMAKGGIPDALKYPGLEINKTIYEDILYRDVVARYGISSVHELKELAFYLISNISRPAVYSKLRQLFGFGSVNTVKDFVEHLENSWLIFVVNLFAFSVKKQQLNPKKIYGIDTGLANNVGFRFSQDRGALFENMVFLELKRRNKNIYYYQAENGSSIDFYVKEEGLLIQACSDFSQKQTIARELRAIQDTAREIAIKKVLILTEAEEKTLKIDDLTVQVLPAWKWMIA